MCTALAAVDDLEFGEGKFKLRCECLDRVFEFTGFQRFELVEKGYDENRIDGHARDLNSQHENPKVVEEVLSGALDDSQESAADGDTKRNGKTLTLEHIRKPQLNRHLVEPEFLFQHEAVVVREAKTSDQINPSQHVHEQERLCNLAREPDGRITGDDGTRGAPDERIDIEVESSERFDLVEETGDEAELGLCATIFLLCVSLLSAGYERMREADLRLVECSSVDLLVECLGDSSAL